MNRAFRLIKNGFERTKENLMINNHGRYFMLNNLEDLQFLKAAMKVSINDIQESIHQNKLMLKDLYKLCVPESENGQYYFDVYNDVKDTNRKLKKQLERFSRIQRSLKKYYQ